MHDFCEVQRYHVPASRGGDTLPISFPRCPAWSTSCLLHLGMQLATSPMVENRSGILGVQYVDIVVNHGVNNYCGLITNNYYGLRNIPIVPWGLTIKPIGLTIMISYS